MRRVTGTAATRTPGRPEVGAGTLGSAGGNWWGEGAPAITFQEWGLPWDIPSQGAGNPELFSPAGEQDVGGYKVPPQMSLPMGQGPHTLGATALKYLRVQWQLP